MTISKLYKFAVTQLSFSECPNFEAMCIFNDILGIKREKALFDETEADLVLVEKLNDVIERRKNGEPLQYIIGEWDFYDMTFFVGKGVLIPRPETEMLVDLTLQKFKDNDRIIVYDLCAGTGCIGLTVAKHLKNSTVYLIEKEENALKYLIRNKEKYGIDNAIIIKGDILNFDVTSLPNADLILSNPPYISTDEIQLLQKEVLNEPITALDGGKDGLMFYRAIASKWTDKVNKNGIIAMECGENQTDGITAVFDGRFAEKSVIFDFNNIDRIITFRI